MLSAILLLSISASYAGFPNGPAEYLFTKEERIEWSFLQTDEQAQAFIEKFWLRRDPTPGTPRNEFRESFNQRVKTADDRFHTARVPGSATDRGKVFAVLGAPTKLRRSRSAPESTIQTGPVFDRNDTSTPSPQDHSPKEVWVYEQGKLDIPLGVPILEVVFIDQYATNDWQVERQPKADIFALFENVARSYLRSDVAALPAGPPKFKNDALRAAIDDVRAGKLPPSPNLFVSVGEFITPAGEDFIPVQLYVPEKNGFAAGENVTFFGAIERGGETVALFEEPAEILPSDGGVYLSRSLLLPPGDYRGTFGIAREGKPLSLISTDLKVAGLDKDAPAISPLILSNHIYPLTEAQSPTDPYSFGGLRVVPKSDATFLTSDELWYFFELRHPGIDPASNAPKLMVKLSVTGKTAAGAPVNMTAPAEETPARELNGVPGHWAVGQAMPLAVFKPGEYTLAVKVTDMMSKSTYELKGQFRIVE